MNIFLTINDRELIFAIEATRIAAGYLRLFPNMYLQASLSVFLWQR